MGRLGETDLLRQALQPRLGGAAFKALSSVVRTLNNIVGGISFVMVAKVLGVQSSAGDEAKAHAKEAGRV